MLLHWRRKLDKTWLYTFWFNNLQALRSQAGLDCVYVATVWLGSKLE